MPTGILAVAPMPAGSSLSSNPFRLKRSLHLQSIKNCKSGEGNKLVRISRRISFSGSQPWFGV
jgi:hypothetical protein